MGISCDSVYALKDWAEHLGGLAYPLCADFWPHGEVTGRYGVLNGEIGRPDRSIFIVDRDGVIRYIDVHALREVPDETEIQEELDKIA